jgi:hypothetical protein
MNNKHKCFDIPKIKKQQVSKIGNLLFDLFYKLTSYNPHYLMHNPSEHDYNHHIEAHIKQE